MCQGEIFKGRFIKTSDITMTNIIMTSWRKSTSIKYQVYKNQWPDFCKNHNINSQNASIRKGLDFLTSLYEKRKQYPTISCARSILSLFIRSSNGLAFGKQYIVQRFMKCIYQLRPSLVKPFLPLMLRFLGKRKFSAN